MTDLATIARVERGRKRRKNQSLDQYYLSSATLAAERFAKAVRAH